MDASCGDVGQHATFSEPTLTSPLKISLSPLSPASTAVPNSPCSVHAAAQDTIFAAVSAPAASAPAAAAGVVAGDDLTTAQSKLDPCAEHDLPLVERKALLGHISKLEAKVEGLGAEAERWRSGYMKSQEQYAIAAGAFEARAESELHGAHEREQQLVAESAALHHQLRHTQESLQRKEAAARQNLSDLGREQESRRRADEHTALLERRARDLEETLAGASALHAEEMGQASAAHSRALREAESHVELLEARNKSLEEVLEDALARHAEELRLERARHGEALAAAQEQHEQAARRAARLQDALDSATAKAQRAEELALDRAQQGARLREAERRTAFLEERLRQLTEDLAAAGAREAELTREAAVFRSHGEHLEQVSQRLRRDLEDERLAGPSRGLSPRPPPRPSPLEPPPGSRGQEGPASPLRRPTGPEQLRRLAKGRQLRREALSPRLDRAASLQPQRPLVGRPEALGGPLPDRTAATGRYNEQGRLVSYDAQGRAV